MVEGKLPEVDPPSDRVPGKSLLALPILEARRRRNRGEIAKKGSVFRGFASRRLNMQRGQPGGPPGVQAATQRGPTLGCSTWPLGHQVGPLRPSSRAPELA